MAIPLRVLILADWPADADLMVYALHKAGFASNWQRVETEADYLGHLHPGLDVILADYTLTQFNVLRALHLLQEQGLNIPFIVLTDTITEVAALECTKQGAADYLFKDRLAQLGPAVKRVLQQRQLHHAKRQVDAALRASEARLQVITEAIPLPVVISRVSDGQILYVNKHLGPAFGLPTEELIDRKTLDFYYDPADRQKLLNVLAQDGHLSNYELHAKKADGTPFWVLASFQMMMLDGEAAIFTGFYDITKSKKTEEALRQVHQQTAQVLAAIPSILIGMDSHATITWWNAAAERLFGVAPAEVVGRPLSVCQLPWDDSSILAGLATCCNTGEPVRIDNILFRRFDGQDGFLGITISPMQGPSGNQIGFLLLGADVTERLASGGPTRPGAEARVDRAISCWYRPRNQYPHAIRRR